MLFSAEDSKKVTALHMACASGNVRGVELLLEANANLKKLDINRLSPSDWAAASGQSAVLALLLTKYKERVLLSEFAIAKACENGSLKCVQLLVQVRSRLFAYFARFSTSPTWFNVLPATRRLSIWLARSETGPSVVFWSRTGP